MGDRRVAENLRLTCRVMIYLGSERRSGAARLIGQAGAGGAEPERSCQWR